MTVLPSLVYQLVCLQWCNKLCIFCKNISLCGFRCSLESAAVHARMTVFKASPVYVRISSPSFPSRLRARIQEAVPHSTRSLTRAPGQHTQHARAFRRATASRRAAHTGDTGLIAEIKQIITSARLALCTSPAGTCCSR